MFLPRLTVRSMATASQPGWVVPTSGGEPTWVDARGGEVPEDAVAGGFDNEQIYVGRASHEGALIPGKVRQQLFKW